VTQSGEHKQSNDPSFPQELRDRYDEVRFLGKGGMGSVFFARDIRLNRYVAIKLLSHTNDNTSSVVRFHQEARAVSKLNNPYVVQVLDFGSTDDSDFFLVMEYIEGEDLEALISRTGSIPIKRTIEIAAKICIGLEHAHTHGIVHRDLKPGNIMIDPDNEVRILDFGVAKIVSHDTDHRITKTGQAMGTILYMSPEQLRGEETDFRSDIYSMGLMIYKMIVGSLPNEDESIMKIIRRRLEDAPYAIPMNESDEGTITKLNRVLERALAHNKNDRFDSMSALKNALSDCLVTEEQEQQQREQRTQKSVITSIVVVVIAGVALAGFLFTQQASNEQKAKNKTLARKHKETPTPHSAVHPSTKSSQGHWIPTGFSEGPERETIYWIAHDYIKNDDLKKLANTGVPSLSLQDNKWITKEGITNLERIPLQALCLRDTKLGDESIDAINKVKKIKLSLRRTKVTEHGVLRLKPSLELVSLDLKYLPITKKSLNFIVKSFPNLRYLNVGESHIRGAEIEVVKNLHSLNCLFIEGIHLEDKHFAKLSGLDNIIEFELASNPITDASIDSLIKKPRLRWISLASCEKVSSGAVDRLQKRFPNLFLEKPAPTKPLMEGVDLFLEESDLNGPL